eukprot:CAMPEP_0197197278 /NCGR_PEP_ID=MMETSP1423-20130617/32787_1 /TAXON_ID=476441 /ORGANISM="Pseudo-nitzschia heimii, Strain UNC1101" /LENGTH=663 /DNA_ID=CAMNT_0042651097 /DNA_START=217 /DNA_END=2204 /DNA_ORIENTATION=-
MIRACGANVWLSAPKFSHSSKIFSPMHQRPLTRSGATRKYASHPTVTPMMTIRRTTRLNPLVYRKASIACGKGGSLLAISLGLGWAWSSTRESHSATSDCEALVVAGEGDGDYLKLTRRPSVRMRDLSEEDETWWSRLLRALRIVRRLCKLSVVFAPVVALYPLHWIHQKLRQALIASDGDAAADAVAAVVLDAHQLALQVSDDDVYISWYYQLCLVCVEWSGAAFIKIMQWAGSRPDMFGREFCAVFSKLQDSTRPHSWKHTERTMIESYGEDWEEKIELQEIIGSGCIAQVYKGKILKEHEGGNGGDDTSDASVAVCQPRKERPVAVKVMHPAVEDDIDADLDIMRLTVWILESVRFGPIENLKWLNLPGFIEEMATMLKTQLDLRKEGEHLVRFNKNFEGNPTVVFPKLIRGYEPTQRVLCETFCDGVPLKEFVKNNKADQTLLTNMCREAIRAVCQMIFLDNFTHGDLHPGNVMVTEDCKFVLLDVGIATVHPEADHRLVSDVLTAFIRKNGLLAGELMIDNSNSRLKAVGDQALDEEKFARKIELVTIAASSENHFMQHLGTYITYICNAASTHHVMLNQAFISMALAVKVQEGIALALDPSVKIKKIAIPIIMEGERRHGRIGERAMELLSIDKLKEWVTGEKTIRYQVIGDDDPHG